MKKLFVVSAALLCLGFFFTGCSKQTESDVQKMEQDVKAGEKEDLAKDAETIAEDVKADVEKGLKRSRRKRKTP